MNPIVMAMKRPLTKLTGGRSSAKLLVPSRLRFDPFPQRRAAPIAALPCHNQPHHPRVDQRGNNVMKTSPLAALLVALISLSLPGCREHAEHHEGEGNKIVVTTPKVQDITVTQTFVCQIHAQRHINV